MSKVRLVRPSWFLGLLCALFVVALMPGCGGGSGGATPPPVQGNPLSGFYIGTYRVDNSPAAGSTGAFSVRVAENGTVIFTSTGDEEDTIIGNVTNDVTFGAFTLNLPAPNGVTFNINGNLTQNPDGTITGTGTFVSSEGVTGTILLNRVAAG